MQPRWRTTRVEIKKGEPQRGTEGAMREVGEKSEDYRSQKPREKRRGPIVTIQSKTSTTGLGKVPVIGDQLLCHLSFVVPDCPGPRQLKTNW